MHWHRNSYHRKDNVYTIYSLAYFKCYYYFLILYVHKVISNKKINYYFLKTIVVTPGSFMKV